MIVDLRRLDEAAENRGLLTASEKVVFTDAFDEEISVTCAVELSYERSGGVYFFHGLLEGTFQTLCHICLTEVPCRIKGDFDVVVRKSGGRQSGGKNGGESEEPEDLITLGVNEYEVSFDKYISENLVVNIPIKIVCKEDCKGLCPQCGVNRNDETCDCVGAPDPRWDDLRKLKNE
jgi:uncharacterized protein